MLNNLNNMLFKIDEEIFHVVHKVVKKILKTCVFEDVGILKDATINEKCKSLITALDVPDKPKRNIENGLVENPIRYILTSPETASLLGGNKGESICSLIQEHGYLKGHLLISEMFFPMWTIVLLEDVENEFKVVKAIKFTL